MPLRVSETTSLRFARRRRRSARFARSLCLIWAIFGLFLAFWGFFLLFLPFWQCGVIWPLWGYLAPRTTHDTILTYTRRYPPGHSMGLLVSQKPMFAQSVANFCRFWAVLGLFGPQDHPQSLLIPGCTILTTSWACPCPRSYFGQF
jgi:hypothetical protein